MSNKINIGWIIVSYQFCTEWNRCLKYPRFVMQWTFWEQCLHLKRWSTNEVLSNFNLSFWFIWICNIFHISTNNYIYWNKKYIFLLEIKIIPTVMWIIFYFYIKVYSCVWGSLIKMDTRLHVRYWRFFDNRRLNKILAKIQKNGSLT